MKFYILAPSLTVHIHDDTHNGKKVIGDSLATCCGIPIYPHVHTHVFDRLTIATEKTMHACKRCEHVFLTRFAEAVRRDDDAGRAHVKRRRAA